MKNDTCQHCHQIIMPVHGCVSTDIKGEQVLLCAFCWNKHIAEYAMSNFETIELKPIALRDCSGEMHTFHFFVRLSPPDLSIDAREILSEHQTGYEFSVWGPQESQADLILDLYEKIRRGLSKKYLTKFHAVTGITDCRVVGRIEWDDDFSGQIPKVVIDGRAVAWDELGKMLMSFEGWQFKLDIFDRTEE